MNRRHFVLLLALPWVPSFAQEPSRPLRLPLAPTPTNAAALARMAVDAALSVDKVRLDYSPKSLKDVDEIVLSLKRERQTADQVGETIFFFGCYVGEVLVRNLGGAWELPDAAARKVGFDTMGVRIKKGFWNPIGKVFKLLANGEEDSLVYFYKVARDA